MLKDRFKTTGPELRISTRTRKVRQKRVFQAALESGERPMSGVTAKMLEKYFEGTSFGERARVELSLLVSMAVVLLALYIVWPTFMQALDIAKEEEQIYDVGSAGFKSDSPAPRAQPMTRVRQQKIPALYPKMNDVTLEIESPDELNLNENYSGLAIDGSIDGVDLGTGDGLGGPVLRAGQGGVIPEPELLFRVEPEYPEPARRERVDGFVLLEAIVNQNGDVVNVKVLQAPPKRYGFAEKAEEAVSKWKFKPSYYNGRPVSVRIRFAVEFNLLY
jgi:TonB family protein